MLVWVYLCTENHKQQQHGENRVEEKWPEIYRHRFVNDAGKFSLDLRSAITDDGHLFVAASAIFLLFDGGDDPPRSASCSDHVFVSDGKKVPFLDGEFLIFDGGGLVMWSRNESLRVCEWVEGGFNGGDGGLKRVSRWLAIVTKTERLGFVDFAGLVGGDFGLMMKNEGWRCEVMIGDEDGSG